MVNETQKADIVLGKNGLRGRFFAALRAAFPQTIPVLTGFAVLGFAYGILMAANGYGPLWSGLMSAIGFGGSAQYAMVPILASVFDPLQAFLLALMINARHLFYGLSMLDKYKGMGKAKFFLVFMLCDETFSIVSSVEPPRGVDGKMFYLFITVLDYSYWVIASVLGGCIGSLLTFDTTGLDFVLTALFVVLFLEQMKNRENYGFGVIGILCSIAAVVLLGADNMVIPSMILIMCVLLCCWKLSAQAKFQENENK